MKEITVKELKDRLDNNDDIILIDVREPDENAAFNIGGELIPLQTVPQNVDKIAKDKEVVIYCRSGNRSGQAVRFLEGNHGYTNLINLKGGMMAWEKEA